MQLAKVCISNLLVGSKGHFLSTATARDPWTCRSCWGLQNAASRRAPPEKSVSAPVCQAKRVHAPAIHHQPCSRHHSAAGSVSLSAGRLRRCRLEGKTFKTEQPCNLLHTTIDMHLCIHPLHVRRGHPSSGHQHQALTRYIGAGCNGRAT